MTKRSLNLRKVATIVACLVVTSTMFSGCGKDPDQIDPNNPTTKEAVELKSPITENTTLKDLGLEVDYFYAGSGNLIVENSATLTIEPGVCIRFSHTGKRGALLIRNGATIKAIGTASKRIQFIGADNSKGSWNGISLETNSDHQFAYCDILNAGNGGGSTSGLGAVYMSSGAKAGFSYCKFTNGNGNGLNIYDYGGVCQITAFDNNVFEDFELAPVYLYNSNLKLLEKFDMTSDFTKNKVQYIDTRDFTKLAENVTLSQTTVPYHFGGPAQTPSFDKYILTINEGVTIYISK